jgi:Flp pilus assembly protein TadG
VEFALVLPILLIVALGLVQAGLILRDQLVLVEAARAGAREASVTDADADIKSAVNRAASTLDPERVGLELIREGAQGDPVTVRLTYDETPEIPLVGWLFPPTIHLGAGATMRQEFG